MEAVMIRDARRMAAMKAQDPNKFIVQQGSL